MNWGLARNTSHDYGVPAMLMGLGEALRGALVS